MEANAVGFEEKLGQKKNMCRMISRYLYGHLLESLTAFQDVHAFSETSNG